MYISRLEITGIRCFEKVEIDFQSSDSLNKWLVILGDNGTGKTTLLRCIAMGLCDEADASALAGELYGEFVRNDADCGVIKVFLRQTELEHGEQDLVIETRIEKIKSKRGASRYRIKQSTAPDPFPWDSLFVCGYGAARHKFETRDHEEYYTIESVYSLFNYDAPLQSPELILRRLDAHVEVDMKNEILPLIERVLTLPNGAIQLTKRGIQMSGPWVEFMPIGAVGDGYQAMLSLLTDFLGWVMFFDASMLRGGVSGILLIDEIEQHMHPGWQKQIIGLLKEMLPRVQFIATTHSPLCAIGTTDLNDEDCQLVLLTQMPTRVQAATKLKPPRRQRADQVLTSYLFGMLTTSDNAVREDIERYSKLVMNKELSRAELNELEEIKKRLDAELGSAESDLEQIVSESVKEALSRTPDASRFPKQVLDYELKRQIKKLLGEDISL